MQAEEIRQFLNAVPFVPFSVHMANGRKFLIDHPELAMFSTRKRYLVVGLPNDAIALADLSLATHLETQPRVNKSKRR